MLDIDCPPDAVRRRDARRLFARSPRGVRVALVVASLTSWIACGGGAEPPLGTGGAPVATGGTSSGGAPATGGTSGATGGQAGRTTSLTGGAATGGAAAAGSGGAKAGASGTGGVGGRGGTTNTGGASPSGGRGGGGSRGGGSGGGTSGRFVFSAFTNESESNMYVYTSVDGTTFKLAKGPAYKPPSGLVRDPSVLHHGDGAYYVVYTTDWNGANFGLARSQDLISWSFVANIPVGISGVTNTWAPEWFRDPDDGSINVIVSLSKSKQTNFTPHRFRATDDTLTKFAPAVQMQGIGPNYIDTFIVKLGATYHNFSKNETTKFIEHGTSASLDGPYTFMGTADWARWGKDLEGPALFRLANGTWRIFMDGYTNSHYYYSDSSDLITWSSKKDLPGGLSGFVRHGTVLPE